MIKLVIVSHALAQEPSQARWRLLAERHPVEVHVLTPRVWRTTWLGKQQVLRPRPIHDGRFHVHPMWTTSSRKWGRYFFISPDAGLRRIQPDVIYAVHEEMICVHHQMLAYRRLWCPSAKYVFFTMHALGVPEKKWHQRLRWRRLRSQADAALCHYPGCLRSLRHGQFRQPVFLQTQIGVDESAFRPDLQERNRQRQALGLAGKFVVGYAGRLSEKKGVHDLLAALPLPNVDWALLLVGGGEMQERIAAVATQRGWQDRVHLTGTAPVEDVPGYMRAMDCFVLGSRTTPEWIDTFPLVTVQAMACGIPVVGSDSGAIPWQLRDTGLIFPEGEVAQLQTHLLALARDPDLRQRLGEAGRERSLTNFCVGAMTDSFHDILQQVVTGQYRGDLPDSDQRRAYL